MPIKTKKPKPKKRKPRKRVKTKRKHKRRRPKKRKASVPATKGWSMGPYGGVVQDMAAWVQGIPPGMTSRRTDVAQQIKREMTAESQSNKALVRGLQEARQAKTIATAHEAQLSAINRSHMFGPPTAPVRSRDHAAVAAAAVAATPGYIVNPALASDIVEDGAHTSPARLLTTAERAPASTPTPTPPPRGGAARQLFNPYTGAVVDRTLFARAPSTSQRLSAQHLTSSPGAANLMAAGGRRAGELAIARRILNHKIYGK